MLLISFRLKEKGKAQKASSPAHPRETESTSCLSEFSDTFDLKLCVRVNLGRAETYEEN